MSSNFIDHFSTLPDPRIERTKRYPLIEVLFLVISAILSGCEGWKAIKDFGDVKLAWLRQFFPYAAGIPVDDTIARVMRRLDSKLFGQCFISWMRAVSHSTDGDVIAIDGKTLRGSGHAGQAQSPIHMVSAWSTANSVVLGQEKTAVKSNEVTAIPALLDVLVIRGCIITIDAMGCQHAIADHIITKKAEYVLALKGNQGHCHRDVCDFFTTAYANHFQGIDHEVHEEIDAGHGRIEQRQCWVIDAKTYATHFSGIDKWPKLSQLVMVKTRREMPNNITHDTRFYIASTSVSAKEMLGIVRKHWHIENSLHWTLDMTFREDESQIYKDAAPENCAIVRHMALNIIKSDTSLKASVKRKKNRAALCDLYRTTLINNAFNLIH